jgi:hypothetical protein
MGYAAGNLDRDSNIDSWFISSKDASVIAACGYHRHRRHRWNAVQHLQ